ncbi:Na(+)-translocating NADH-quinone reductase subunit C [Planctomycetes bacterium Poly30]|uniref:Na(+)-translocating NADH-quinone reductase subunit C n=1 Tax=Saltatorellus ferox TaxID=2528018 RepID=A0A518EWT3_9BACT|nr:Na(+)-translocating NADH-quinone reductase subunit C [Planctomycetes bacterium Poly30]
MDFSNKYVIGFAVGICVVCSALVSFFAVSLGARQDANKVLDQQRQVVTVAGLAAPGEALTQERVDEIFKDIQPRVIDRKTGEYIDVSVEDVDPIRMAKDPETSEETPEAFKGAQIARLPDQLEVFEVTKPGSESIVLPIHGKGLWSTMYGYLSIKRDLSGVVGITFYSHGETPGLGGEIDNKAWQASWIDRAIYDAEGDVELGVVKANAPRNPDYQVDGLSGATITTKGVDATIKLWLGPAGYGPYLQRIQGN